MTADAPVWRPRTVEDRMLRAYLRRLARQGRRGAVHIEVPFGVASGGSPRRIDAVRFARGDEGPRRHRTATFAADLAAGGPIDLIEVKRRLNRPVIGQLVAAERLVRREWRLAPTRRLGLVAVVTEVDEALALACRDLGIRVEVVRAPG